FGGERGGRVRGAGLRNVESEALKHSLCNRRETGSGSGEDFVSLRLSEQMPVYVALLRGINVGGHKRVPMDQLRKLCEGLGFGQVKTYIQSGNVVFKARKTDPAALSKRLEKEILKHFGF